MTSSIPDWLDCCFCELLLRNIDESLELRSWEAEPLGVSGDNYSSVLYSVSLNSTKSVFSLIIKSLPEGSIMREYMLSNGIFSKELGLYNKIFPNMYRLYRERGGTRGSCFPQSYQCPIANTVVLQDLRTQRFIVANRQLQFDMDHSIVAIRTLAFFHGLSVGLDSQTSSDVQCYKENIYTACRKEILNDYTSLMLRDLISEVETWEGFQRFGDKLKKYSKRMVDAWIDIYERKNNFFLVMNHGDFWTGNMMFRYNENGEIEDMKLIDFQYCLYGPAVLDILYLLYTSVQEDVRIEHMHKLLHEYLAELEETLDILGCSEQLPSLEKLEHEIREKMDIVAMIAFTRLPAIVANKEEMANFGTSDDVESFQNPLKNCIKGARYRKLLPAILIDLERNGIL